MSGDELKRIRLAIGFAPRDMYRSLGLPRRTFQDYEAGKRSIPTEVAETAREIQRRDREFMKRLPGRLAAAIDKDFPNGIHSAIDRTFNEE